MRFGGWFAKRLDHLAGSRRLSIIIVLVHCPLDVSPSLFSASNRLNASPDMEIYPYVIWIAALTF